MYLAVVKAALRNVHGDEAIDNDLSGYYLAGNIARTYDRMMNALLPNGLSFMQCHLTQLAEVLLQLTHLERAALAQPKWRRYWF